MSLSRFSSLLFRSQRVCIGQLLWREFFYLVGHATENFDQMLNNSICKQIPWENDEKLLRAWSKHKSNHVRECVVRVCVFLGTAQTGYPWIDAIMTQLAKEGWMHHLARHCVACFLTRGDLWQSWEKGKVSIVEE
jgi:cryptochrome